MSVETPANESPIESSNQEPSSRLRWVLESIGWAIVGGAGICVLSVVGCVGFYFVGTCSAANDGEHKRETCAPLIAALERSFLATGRYPKQWEDVAKGLKGRAELERWFDDSFWYQVTENGRFYYIEIHPEPSLTWDTHCWTYESQARAWRRSDH